jgi:demethylmenaquinone methyltransferase/2-methoxy-6-polyprenyl-1,4-benzoquinol methylase
MLDHFGYLAPVYDRVIGPPDPARLQDLLRLPVAGRLLDAGGGTGRVSSQLRPLVDELFISDLSGKLLLQAQEKGLCCPAVAHVEELPFPDDSFERLLVVDALHHFCDQREAIAELVRVLKPGGRLLIEEPDLNRYGVKLIAIAEKLALMRSRFYYPHEICDMVAAHGLPAFVETDGRFAAWIVADKSN